MNSIKCVKLSVDCVVNDPVDVRAGGPEYLGFDFFVKEQDIEEMKAFINIILNNLEVPLIDIYVSEYVKLTENYIWTKEKIIQSINKDVDYLKHEANRNYKLHCRK